MRFEIKLILKINHMFVTIRRMLNKNLALTNPNLRKNQINKKSAERSFLVISGENN